MVRRSGSCNIVVRKALAGARKEISSPNRRGVPDSDLRVFHANGCNSVSTTVRLNQDGGLESRARAFWAFVRARSIRAVYFRVASLAFAGSLSLAALA